MSAYSVFQASFDGGLRPQHRRRGRLAAAALKIAAVAVVGGSLLTLLHQKSNQLSDLANAGSPRDVNLAAAKDRSCADQSWPFIEGRCLIDTKSLRQSERGILRPPLADRQKSASHGAALASRKKRARTKAPDDTTVTAARSRSTPTAVSTTGTSPRDEAASAPVKASNASPSVATPPEAAQAASATPPRIDNAVASRRAQDQQRREARRKERLTREQREARAEMRSRRDEQRSASRWDGNAYSSSYSGGWPRGPFEGGFFSTIR